MHLERAVVGDPDGWGQPGADPCERAGQPGGVRRPGARARAAAESTVAVVPKVRGLRATCRRRRILGARGLALVDQRVPVLDRRSRLLAGLLEPETRVVAAA